MSETGSTASTLVLGVRTDAALQELERLTAALRALPSETDKLNKQMVGMGTSTVDAAKKATAGVKEVEEGFKKFGGSVSVALESGSVSFKTFGTDVVTIAGVVAENSTEMQAALAKAGIKTTASVRAEAQAQVRYHKLAVAERIEAERDYTAAQQEVEHARTLIHKVSVAERIELDKQYAELEAARIAMNNDLIKEKEHARTLMHKIAVAERIELDKQYAELEAASITMNNDLIKEKEHARTLMHKVAVAERVELDKQYAEMEAARIAMNNDLVKEVEHARTLMHRIAVAERIETEKYYAEMQAALIGMNNDLAKEKEHERTLMHKVAVAERMEADRASSAAQKDVEHERTLMHKVAVAERLELDRAAAAAEKEAEYARTLMHKVAVAERMEADRAAAAAATPNTGALTNHTSATRDLAAAERELHSGLRGVSGALGGLWVTYGSMIPLLAGFAAAASMREAVVSGKDFEYQMKFVKAVTGETTENMQGLSAQLLSMSNGSLFNPVELAGGMRTLAQAGLTTKEALATLPTVMALATAGETDLATAVETTTGIMHAFNLNVGDMGQIGDILAKAAAISVTSVAGMSESMKQASTVAQQFDLSIGEVSAGLVVLAERNIKGSAAGTAFRNMMQELSSPTDKARTALAKLGVSLYDATGNTRPLAAVMDELRNSLKSYDVASQNLLTSTIFGERGNKGAQAILSKTAAEFSSLIGEIESGTGFLNRTMAELEDTVQGKFTGVMSTMKASFIQAFDESNDSLIRLGGTLQNAFASDEFKTTIKNLGSLVMGLTNLMVEHALAIGVGGVVYLAYKAYTVGAFLLTAEITTLTGITYGAATATRILTAAMMANPLTAVIVAVTAAAGAYLLFRDNTNGAADALDQSKSKHETEIKLLDRELDSVTKLNDELERKLGLRKSEAQEGEATINASRDKLRAEIAKLEGDKQAQKGVKILGADGKGADSMSKFFNGEDVAKGQLLISDRKALNELNEKAYQIEVKKQQAQDNQFILDANKDAEARARSGKQHVTADELKPNKDKTAQINALNQQILDAYKASNTDAKAEMASSGRILDDKLSKHLVSQVEYEQQRLTVEASYAAKREAAMSTAETQINRIKSESDRKSTEIQLQGELKRIQMQEASEKKRIDLQRNEKLELDRNAADESAKKFKDTTLPGMTDKWSRDREVIERKANLDKLTTLERVAAEARIKIETDAQKHLDTLQEQRVAAASQFKEDSAQVRALTANIEALTAARDAEVKVAVKAAVDKQNAENTWSAGASTAFTAYMNEADNAAKKSSELVGKSLKGMEDALVSFVKTGKIDFKSLADSIITDLIRIATQKAIVGMANMAISALGGGGSGSFGAAGAASTAMGSLGTDAFSTQSMMLASQQFADGGIMTSRGSVPLRKYSGGGIANSPQLAMYGEGSTPEAFVPVPSGHIPVEIRGAVGGGSSIVNITVNISDSGTSSKTDGAESGKKLADIISASVTKELVNQKRPGGLLAA